MCGVRALPFCEPVRLGTSMQLREYPKLVRLPSLKILQYCVTEMLPELEGEARGFGFR